MYVYTMRKAAFTLIYILFPLLLISQNKMDSNGKLQGKWKFYDYKWELVATGKYKDSNPVGKHVYYEDGEKIAILNYSKDGSKSFTWKYLEMKPISGSAKYNEEEEEWQFFDDAGTQLDPVLSDRILSSMEVMCNYIGGQSEIYVYLGKVLKYPPEAMNMGVEGTSYISFVIDKSGNVIDAEVLKPFNDACDLAALDAVRKMPRWQPATSCGYPLKIRINIPIRFSLSNK